MLALLGVAVVALAAVRIRQALPGRVVTRLSPGDAAVVSSNGLVGTVVEIRRERALLQLDAASAVWVERQHLLAWDGASVPVAADPANLRTYDLPGTSTEPRGAFARLGEIVGGGRKVVAFGWLALVIVTLPLAGTLQQALSSGGFTPPGEAQNTGVAVRDTFHQPATALLALTTDDPATVTRKLAPHMQQLMKVDHVQFVGPPKQSADGQRTQVAIAFDGTDDEVWGTVGDVEKILGADAKLANVKVAGTPVVFRDINDQTQKDLAKAEGIGMPVALLVLLVVFGTLPAATVTLAIGIVTVLVTMALLHIVSLGSPLSVYVMNIASMLGLGLGIDYSLLGVTRFREELASGIGAQRAAIRTVATAGKATVISAIAVMTGLSGLALFPLPVLRSIAIAGVVVVAVAAFASITLLPALLVLLGDRVERWRVRPAKPSVGHGDEEGTGRWIALARAVMRRPALAIAAGAMLLLWLAHPTAHTSLDVPHSGVLPVASPSRVAEQELTAHFGASVAAPMWVVLGTADTAKDAVFLKQLAATQGVDTAEQVATAGNQALFHLTTKEDREGGPKARAVVERIQMAQSPAHVAVGGQAAEEIAFLDTIRHNAVRAALFVAIATFVILLVAFRSLLLPLKAIVLDSLSITAALGAVIAVFQNGSWANMLGTHGMGYTEATMPVILFAVLFGLSMDYEVFMLANIAELYQMGASNRDATARGMAWTAPLVTGAALILVVIGLSFASTELVLVKEIGFGMAVALALDATVVRCLLVPATMRLLGDQNWWLPESIGRYVPRMSWAH